MQETVCICPVQCAAHSRCSINISRTSSEMEAVTRWAVLSITGSDSPLQVPASAELKPTSHSFQPAALVSEGRSGTNTIKGRGEKPSSSREQRGRSGQEERTNYEGECSLKSIRTHHPASLCTGSASALNGPKNDLPVHNEPGPRIPWQLELKLVALWTSLGIVNKMLPCVYTHDNMLVVNNNKNDNDSYYWFLWIR